MTDRDHEQVVDIGLGRAGEHPVAELGERVARAVAREGRLQVEPGAGRAPGRVPVDDRPGGAGSAVGPVGVEEAGGDRDAVGERQRRRQRRLLVRAAGAEGPVAPQRDRRLAPAPHQHARERPRAVAVGLRASHPGKHPAELAGLALEPGGNDPCVRAGPLGLEHHRLAGAAAGDEDHRMRLALEPRGLGRRRREVVADAVGQHVPELAVTQDRDRVGDGRAVLDRRVGDRVEDVARDVGRGQVDERRRGDPRRQPAALERRHVLADRVHLGDRGARGEQQLVQAALVRSADPGRREAGERGAAAGERCEHEVAGSGVGGELGEPAGARDRAFARQRVIGEQDLDPLELDRVLAVANHHGTGVHPRSEATLERGGDRQGRLSGADDDHARVLGERVGPPGDLDRSVLSRDGALGCEADVACREARARDSKRELAQLGHSPPRELARVGDPSGGGGGAHPVLTRRRPRRHRPGRRLRRPAPPRCGSGGCTSPSARRAPGRRS